MDIQLENRDGKDKESYTNHYKPDDTDDVKQDLNDEYATIADSPDVKDSTRPEDKRKTGERAKSSRFLVIITVVIICLLVGAATVAAVLLSRRNSPNTPNANATNKSNSWTNWTDGECSTTCGEGFQTRTRTCNSTESLGKQCEGMATETVACDVAECGNEPQIVPGTLTLDQEFVGDLLNPASAAYQDLEMNVRQELGSALQSNYPDSFNDVTISGFRQGSTFADFFVTLTSNLDRAALADDVLDFIAEAIISGTIANTSAVAVSSLAVTWGSWSSFGTCSVTCGSGTRDRTRSCLDPFITGDSCTGDMSETSVCNDASCVTWSEWNAYGPCSATCGTGMSERTRTCSDPDTTGDTCTGDSSETMSCQDVTCVTWSKWNAYGPCSVTCGTGISERTRECLGSDSTGVACSGDNSETMSCQDAICAPPDPEWVRWAAWSMCDATCNGGSQSRTRTCDDPIPADLLTCIGQPTDTRNCNIWTCPACNDPCSSGTRNADCVCVCDTSVLNGRVTDGNNSPLDGAQIARADRPDIVLATTGSDGTFSITGVCAQAQTMIVTREMFTTFTGGTTQVDSITSTIVAVIERMELPFITNHPRGKLRVAGESVAFCCMASSEPPPTKYEWYRNGDIIEAGGANSEKLILSELGTTDTGSYACRVHNDAGCIFSNSAELIVTESVTSCGNPISKVVELPTDCVQPDTGMNMYDVGMCKNIECHGTKTDQTLCEDMENENYCCQPIQTETVTLTCQGYTLPVQKTLSCGCDICFFNPSSIMVLAQNSITDETLEYVEVYYKNENQGLTDAFGSFSLEIADQTRRVSLFLQDTFLKRVSNTNVLIEITSGANIQRIVKMKPRPIPMMIDSTQETSISLAKSGNNEPVAELVIMPNTIVDEEGMPYSGNVMTFVANFDMRDMNDVEAAPSDFMAADENGRDEELQSFGVFSLGFEDPEGNPLRVGGSSMVMVNQDMIPECNLDEEGFCDTKLWVLDTKTGLWAMESKLKPSQTSTKKRQTTSELVGSISYSCSSRWACLYNIDRFQNSQRCWAHVVGFETKNFNAPLSNILVTSIVQDSTINFLRRNSAWAVSRTSFGVCVPMGCDDVSTATTPVSNRRFTTYITVSQSNEYLLPFDTSDNLLNQADFKLSSKANDLDYFIDKGQQNTAIRFKPTIVYASSNGPIHPGYRAGYSRGSCSTATSSKDYFQFYRSNGLLCNTFRPVDLRNPTMRQILTFYPLNRSNQKQYCFVGARITMSGSAPKIKVTATSSILNMTPSTVTIPPGGQTYFGRREITVARTNNMFDACLEYKCGGPAFNGLMAAGNAYTKVTIDVKDTTGTSMPCRVVTEAAGTDCNGNQLSIGTTYSTPFCFTDPQNYGDPQKLYRFLNSNTIPSSARKNDCSGDSESYQSTDTSSCKSSGGVFNPLITITC